MKKLLLFPVIFIFAFILINFTYIDKAYALSCGGTTTVSSNGTGSSPQGADVNCATNVRARCTSTGGLPQPGVNYSGPWQDSLGLWHDTCAVQCKYPTWTCSSTICTGSNGCTYDSGVSCSSTYGYCHYSSSTPNSKICCPASTPTPTPKPATTCTAGTGTTNASCGGNQTACQCNGSSICATQGYYCSAGSCVKGWAGGSSCAISSCPVGSICNPGAGTTPVNGVCAATHYSCVSGSSQNQVAVNSNTWTWDCAGTNGGSTASCVEAPAPPQTFSISGLVYIDTNGNGKRDCVDGSTNMPSCPGSSLEQGYPNGLSIKATDGTNTYNTNTFNYNLYQNYSIDIPSGGGTYSVTIPTIPSGYTVSSTPYPQTVTVTGTNYGINIGLKPAPTFTISGDVFVDQNKDGLQNGGDVNYTGAITIGSTGRTVTYPAPAGNYLISNLPGGTYTVSYSWPARYFATNPKASLRPATFTVTVGDTTTGTPCSTNGALGALCDANGNITTLRFGISNSLPWIQAISGDITGSNISDPNGGGFSNPIPAGATCGTYTSLPGSVAGGGTTPGIVYSGAGAYDFGSGQASQDPYNWVVGGVSYPDVYQPKTAGVIATSYSYITSIAKQSGITPTDLTSYCGSGGLNSCTLPSNLPNGVYLANGGLTLTGPSYTFPANKNYVILVNGDLNINTEIHVPVGSTATFSSSNDIIVGATVGVSTPTSTTPNIEGYFSADKHFTIKGVNSCPTTDLRLNVAGSIVVNAALNSASSLATQANFVSGGFVNERDLCATDLQCPAFSVIERPDFIIYAPDFFKTTRRIWREVNP